jgi:hypothetical protein
MQQDLPYKSLLYGFPVLSCLLLPNPSPFVQTPEIIISYGKVPESLDHFVKAGARYQASPGQLLLKVDNIARFLVTGGNAITIEKLPGASEEDIRVFLIAPVFSAIIHQRGLLPVHGSAIRSGNGAVIFAGNSGAGKSTLVAALIHRGYKLVTDDLSVISIDNNGIPVIFPGFPQLKLWEDSLKKLGEDPASLKKVRQNLNKFIRPATGHFEDTALPVSKIFILHHRNTEGFEINQLKGLEKFSALKNNTYRAHFVKGLGNIKNHFRHINAVAKHSEIFNVFRPDKNFLLEELADLIQQQLLITKK